jgi:capsid protein
MCRRLPIRRATISARNLASWRPWLASPDAELLYERDTITARIRDLVRNNGWASSAVTRELDNVIGGGLRLSSKPDWRRLGLSEDWAHEFSSQVEGCGAALPTIRTSTATPRAISDERPVRPGISPLSEGRRRAGRPAVAAGPAVRVGDGRADRASGSPVQPERPSRHGLAARRRSARREWRAIGYHIRKRHPHDVADTSGQGFVWEHVPRETEWGRPIVAHHYDKDAAGQTRGIGRLTPILERLKMLDKYDRVELQAAVLNAIFSAFIESPLDHEFAEGIIGGDSLGKYQDERTSLPQGSEHHVGRRPDPDPVPG